MAQLLSQAPEILHLFFKHVETPDLAAVARTCHHLNDIIRNDELLWKLHYLDLCDPPASGDGSESWRSRTTRLINLQKLLQSDNEDIKTQNIEEILKQTLALLNPSEPESTKNTDFLSPLYGRGININRILCQSSLFARARRPEWPSAPTEDLRQLSAQLHVFAGMNIDSTWPKREESVTLDDTSIFGLMSDDSDDDEGHSDSESTKTVCTPSEETLLHRRNNPTPLHDIHPWARSRVYDLRRYKASNMWGPFTNDNTARIDWEKVQSIMTVLAFKHRTYTRNRGDRFWRPHFRPTEGRYKELLSPWQVPFKGIATNSYVSEPLEGKIIPAPHPDLDALDPYGVTGTWSRIVCFLDYNDLFRFNFERQTNLPDDQEREPIAEREAFRVIRLQLHVIKIEEQEGVDQHGRPLLPIVYFEGTSKSTTLAWDPNANSRIRGSVHQTPSGTIRWTSFSIFHGEERWRSEGVQIGGLKSARGVLGSWFDKDYGAHGPAGPTAFWKVSDIIVKDESRPPHGMMQIFLAE